MDTRRYANSALNVHRTGRLGATSLLAFAVSLTLANHASAQNTADPAAATSPAATPSSHDIEEIIVTARKRNERLLDVPVAVSAFTGEELTRQGVASIQQVAARTPQLVISATSTPSNGVINMRGIGSPDASPSIDQAVSINIDGVQVSQADAVRLGLYDLERVEVLKGPQALFFGKNSPAGVISLVSASPSDTFETRARTGYEFNTERRFIEGMMSSPITDSLGFRLVGAYDASEGWFRNRAQAVPGGIGATQSKVPNQEEYFARGTLQYEKPEGGFDAILKVSYDDLTLDNSVTSAAQAVACPLGAPAGSFGVPGANTDCKLDRYTIDADISPAAAALAPELLRDGRGYFLSRQSLASLTMNVGLGDRWTLTSVSGYFKSHTMWNGSFNAGEVERLVTASDSENEQYTQELRLASSFDMPLNFVLGGFYQDATLDFGVPAIVSGPLAAGFGSPTPLLLSDDLFHQQTKAWSVFGQAIWAFAPQWELTAGGRYSHEEKEGDAVRSPSVFSGGMTLPLPFVDPEVSFNNFSPEVSLRFQPNTDVTLFAAYRTGFTSGGYNFAPLSSSVGTFKQAKAKGGEAGVKAALADGQVRIDMSVYQYKYTDLQLSSLEPGTVTLTVRNAGSATIRGAELSTTASPDAMNGLSLHSSFAYNDAHYDDFDNAGCYAGQTVAMGCAGGVVGGVAFTQDLSDEQLERAPKWTLNVGTLYEHAFSGGMTGFISADANYISSFNVDTAHDPRAEQDEVWRYSASVGLRGANNRWDVSLIGKNLSNELRLLRASNTPFTGFGTGTNGPAMQGDLTGNFSEPRTVLLQLTMRW